MNRRESIIQIEDEVSMPAALGSPDASTFKEQKQTPVAVTRREFLFGMAGYATVGIGFGNVVCDVVASTEKGQETAIKGERELLFNTRFLEGVLTMQASIRKQGKEELRAFSLESGWYSNIIVGECEQVGIPDSVSNFVRQEASAETSVVAVMHTHPERFLTTLYPSEPQWPWRGDVATAYNSCRVGVNPACSVVSGVVANDGMCLYQADPIHKFVVSMRKATDKYGSTYVRWKHNNLPEEEFKQAEKELNRLIMSKASEHRVLLQAMRTYAANPAGRLANGIATADHLDRLYYSTYGIHTSRYHTRQMISMYDK